MIQTRTEPTKSFTKNNAEIFFLRSYDHAL